MSYQRKRRRRRRVPVGYIYIAATIILTAILVVGIYAAKKYTPTKEHMDLAEYFTLTYENQAAVILNNEYKDPELWLC